MEDCAVARLKSRNNFPPGSFQAIFPEAGMKKPFQGSFNECVQFVLSFRKKNPTITAKNGWTLDQTEIETWVDEHNSARLMANGWTQWVEFGGGSTPLPDGKKNGVWRSVVEKFRRVGSGAMLLKDWLGSGARPVEGVMAEKRALVCVGCPKNDGADFTAYFTHLYADRIKAMLQIKHDMELKTSVDEKLTVCSACDCPLKLKVWCPIETINQRLSSDTRTRLDPRCWVLSESK